MRDKVNSRLPGVDCELNRFLWDGLSLLLQQLLQSLETGDMDVSVETLLEQTPQSTHSSPGHSNPANWRTWRHLQWKPGKTSPGISAHTLQHDRGLYPGNKSTSFVPFHPRDSSWQSPHIPICRFLDWGEIQKTKNDKGSSSITRHPSKHHCTRGRFRKLLKLFAVRDQGKLFTVTSYVLMVEGLLDADKTFIDKENVGSVKFSEPILKTQTADLTAALLDTRDQDGKKIVTWLREMHSKRGQKSKWTGNCSCSLVLSF